MSEISMNVDRVLQFDSTGVENWQRLFKIVYCLIFCAVYIILFSLSGNNNDIKSWNYNFTCQQIT